MKHTGREGKSGSHVCAILVFIISGFISFAAVGRSICEFDWKPGESLAGVNGPVYAMIKWDVDGEGPKEEMLVVGGRFTIAGDKKANNIAAFDGNEWHSLSSGTSGQVNTLCIFNGRLVAGGEFSAAGNITVNHTAQWDGNNWQAFGSGVNGSVLTMAVYNGNLYSGGSYFAVWNGSSWTSSEIRTGYPVQSLPGKIYALTVYDGKLIVGGDFVKIGTTTLSRIAAWNGTQWQTIGDGIATVYALAVFNNQLIASGGGYNSIYYVAKLNENVWEWDENDFNNKISCLTVYENELYAGGSFTTINGNDANNIAVWDGSNWAEYGEGMNGNVTALATFKNKLVAGGEFTEAGESHNKYISIYDNDYWRTLGKGINNAIYAITMFQGKTVIGGEFSRAGNADCNFVSIYDGENFAALGGGMNDSVKTFAEYNGQLIAGGKFTRAGSGDANHIACWDGTDWRPLGGGLNGNVNALVVYNGLLIAGGEFTTAEDITVNYIAAWNGTNWQAFGGGMDNQVNALIVNGTDNTLVAGGKFRIAGTTNVNHAAVWNGSSWTPFGSTRYEINALAIYNNQIISGGMSGEIQGLWRTGVNGNIYTLTVHHNKLLVAGSFTRVVLETENFGSSFIAAWDGQKWEALQFGVDNSIYALMSYKDTLFAGGEFIKAGENVSASLTKWELTHVYEGDLNSDCTVNFEDYVFIANNWMKENCDGIIFCGGADIDIDQNVDAADLKYVGEDWLRGRKARQCEFELKPGQSLPGLDLNVLCMVSWDQDGDGPESPVLVVGGEFTRLSSENNGGPLLNHIAVWDGNSFLPLGNGYSSNVSALAVYNNQLIIGNGAQVWDGTSWQPLGGGVNGNVYEFAVYDGKLIAAGQFGLAGEPAVNIAAWDGVSWQAVEEIPGYSLGIRALTVYNGQLIAGGEFSPGDFNSIAAWDGESWHKLGGGVKLYGNISELAVYNGKLIASGDFSEIDGIQANGMAQWNGSSWAAIEEGVGGGCLAVYNNKLIASRTYFSIYSNVSQWDGSSWQTVGNGTDNYVKCFCVHKDELIVGGSFTYANYKDTALEEQIKANKIASWNGNRWKAFGNGIEGGYPDSILSSTVYNDNLIIGGNLQRAGGKVVNNIAKWNGKEWEKLGSGVNGPVYALTVYNGELIAGGNFTTAGGVTVGPIAKWNDSNWQEFAPYGGGLPGQLKALLVYNGQLIAAGAFSEDVLLWNGERWEPVGGFNQWQWTYDKATTLTIYEGQLVAAFEKSDHTVTAFFNGATWQGIGTFEGGSLLPRVRTLFEHNGQLIAGGNFQKVGGVDMKYIAAWDGNAWRTIGQGILDSGGPIVKTFISFDGDLYAGGYQVSKDYYNNRGLLKWDGGVWQDTEVKSGNISALAIYKGELIIGGSLAPETIPSMGWMRYGAVRSFEGDLNHDCGVDEYDLMQLGEQWLSEGCRNKANCDEADLNYDDSVDFADFSRFAPSWNKE